MQFEVVKDILLSDTLVPDIFLSDIMPRLPSDAVKVYLYCIFLSKYNKEARPEDMAAKLDLSMDTVNAVFLILEKEGLILRTPKVISLTNVKEQALSKLYKKKTTSDVETANSKTQANIRRNQCIDSINKMFFQGIMAPSWYAAIDNWFSDYRFDEDVMVSLFKFCYDNNALNIKYIEKVAATWASKNITNHWELEKYMEACERTKEIGKVIARSLRLGKKLTTYEEKYLETWLNEYGYDMTIIDEALKLTVGKSTPFKYAHNILTNWHKEGIQSLEQLKAYQEASFSAKTSKPKVQSGKTTRRGNFQQRSYDDDFYDKLEKL
ncbi:MAG: DnaD domain protein [Clostridiaceae bacterium]|jgi:DnaD/phage-associated family protein|nr:DnaD domain protein [Clostridiaceae bacterium]